MKKTNIKLEINVNVMELSLKCIFYTVIEKYRKFKELPSYQVAEFYLTLQSGLNE